MKKKKILLLTSIASIALFSAAAIVFSTQKSSSKLSAGDDTNDYEIVFTSSDLTSHNYDDDNYVYKFTVGAEKIIGGSYDLFTKEFDVDWSGTYLYLKNPTSTNPTFGSGSIFTCTPTSNDDCFNVMFDILYRADFSLTKSHIGLFIGSSTEMTNIPFDLSYYDAPDGHIYYDAPVSLASYYGSQVRLAEIKLVFSCAK